MKCNMKGLSNEIYLIVILGSISGIANSYEISLSQNYLKMEINKWSNFTIYMAVKEYTYDNVVIMEVNHTSNVRVSPRFVEIHSTNFSNWCHMFHVYALKSGRSKIQFNFGNSSLSDNIKELHVDADVVKMKSLEPYGDWCRKYYYIFSVVSVYPQIFLQFLRLSVVGLDMDYVCFNFIGHLSYGIYTFFVYNQMDYHVERQLHEYFPVSLSEVMYAVHGLITAILLGIQSFKYYGIDKRVSTIGKELITFYGIVFIFSFLLAKFQVIQYLDFLYICNYIHFASTGTKYVPQLYKNYVIKTTFGWNILNSHLELTGCIALIINFLITSYNYDNWINIVRSSFFWMACAISVQHVLFIIQHYLIYKKRNEFDLSELQEITLQEKITLYEERIDPC